MVDTKAMSNDMAHEFLRKTAEATEWLHQEHANLPMDLTGKDVEELEKQIVMLDKLFCILMSPNSQYGLALSCGGELIVKKHPCSNLIHVKLFELEQHMTALKTDIIRCRNRHSLSIGEMLGDKYAMKVDYIIQVMGFYEHLAKNITYCVDEPITYHAIIEHYGTMLELPEMSKTVRMLRSKKASCLIEEYSLVNFLKLEPNSIHQDSQDLNLAIETLFFNMEEAYNDFRRALSLHTTQLLMVLQQQGLLNSRSMYHLNLWEIIRIDINDITRWLQEHDHLVSSACTDKFLDKEPTVSEVENQLEKHEAFQAELRIYSKLINTFYGFTQLTFGDDFNAPEGLIQKAKELKTAKKLSQLKARRRKLDLDNALAMAKTLEFLEKAELVKTFLEQTLELMNSYDYGTDKASNEKQYEILLDYHLNLQYMSTDYLEKLDRITAGCKVKDPNSNVPAAVKQRLNGNDLSDFEKALKEIVSDRAPKNLRFECEAYLNWFCDDDIGENFYEKQGLAIDKVVNLIKEKHSNLTKLMVPIFKNFAYLGNSFYYLPEVNDIGNLFSFLEAENTPKSLLQYHTHKTSIPSRMNTLFDACRVQWDTPVFNRAQVEALNVRWSAVVELYEARTVIFKKQLHEKSVAKAQQSAVTPRQPEAGKRRGRPRKL